MYNIGKSSERIDNAEPTTHSHSDSRFSSATVSLGGSVSVHCIGKHRRLDMLFWQYLEMGLNNYESRRGLNIETMTDAEVKYMDEHNPIWHSLIHAQFLHIIRTTDDMVYDGCWCSDYYQCIPMLQKAKGVFNPCRKN